MEPRSSSPHTFSSSAIDLRRNSSFPIIPGPTLSTPPLVRSDTILLYSAGTSTRVLTHDINILVKWGLQEHANYFAPSYPPFQTPYTWYRTVLASCANSIREFQLLNPYKCLYNPTRIGNGGPEFNRWSGVVYRLDITPYFHRYLTCYSAIYFN